MERLTKWGASISETGRGNDWRLNAKMLDRYVEIPRGLNLQMLRDKFGYDAVEFTRIASSSENWRERRTTTRLRLYISGQPKIGRKDKGFIHLIAAIPAGASTRTMEDRDGTTD